MTTFVKRECQHHPGHWTMNERCDQCFREEADRILAELYRSIWKATKGAGSKPA